MNKFIKYGTLAGFLLILTGTGVSTAAFAMGGSFDKINEYFWRRYESEHGRWETKLQVAIEKSAGAWENRRVHPSVREAGMESWQGEFPMVTELQVYVCGGKIELAAEGGRESLLVEGEGGDIERAEFYSDQNESVLRLSLYDGEKMTVHVPEGWIFDEMEVDLDFGEFAGRNLKVGKLDLYAGDGKAVMTQIDGVTADLSCQNGQIIWEGVGSAFSMIDAASEGGQIQIALPAESPWGEFGGKAECKDGKIETPEFSIEGESKRRISEEIRNRLLDLKAEHGGVITIR